MSKILGKYVNFVKIYIFSVILVMFLNNFPFLYNPKSLEVCKSFNEIKFICSSHLQACCNYNMINLFIQILIQLFINIHLFLPMLISYLFGNYYLYYSNFHEIVVFTRNLKKNIDPRHDYGIDVKYVVGMIPEISASTVKIFIDTPINYMNSFVVGSGIFIIIFIYFLFFGNIFKLTAKNILKSIFMFFTFPFRCCVSSTIECCILCPRIFEGEISRLKRENNIDDDVISDYLASKSLTWEQYRELNIEDLIEYYDERWIYPTPNYDTSYMSGYGSETLAARSVRERNRREFERTKPYKTKVWVSNRKKREYNVKLRLINDIIREKNSGGN